MLLLDLYVAWLEDPDLSVGVAMSVNAWNTTSRYNALHLSKRLLNIIPALQEAELLDVNKGSYSVPNAPGNRVTRIRASKSLQQLFSDAKFSRPNIMRAAEEEIIILKDDQGRKVEYEDTPETTRMRERLKAYNQLIASSFIDIRSLEEPVLAITDDDGDTRGIRLDEDTYRTHRIFSRGSWNHNGRFFGGWWQRVNSDLRSKICIDNQPTIEVDFQGLHVAMLYAKTGQAMTRDPYKTFDNNYSGMPPELLRKLTKKLALMAINAKDKSSAYRSFRNDFPTGHAGKAMTNDQLDGLLDAFVVRNPCLEAYLFDDQGIRLMRLDAKITEHVHSYFTQKGIPVLSVHDSYIIDVHYVDELRQFMAEASEQVVGRPLRCGVSIPHFGEFDDVPEKDIKEHIGRLTWAVYGGDETACKGYMERMVAYDKRTGRSVSPV